MVRLKVNPATRLGLKVFLFQFLMVRLKDEHSRLQKACVKISIPYGAIKRVLSLCLHRKNTHISIPYGAIKRNELSADMTDDERDFNSLWCD